MQHIYCNIPCEVHLKRLWDPKKCSQELITLDVTLTAAPVKHNLMVIIHASFYCCLRVWTISEHEPLELSNTTIYKMHYHCSIFAIVPMFCIKLAFLVDLIEMIKHKVFIISAAMWIILLPYSTWPHCSSNPFLWDAFSLTNFYSVTLLSAYCASIIITYYAQNYTSIIGGGNEGIYVSWTSTAKCFVTTCNTISYHTSSFLEYAWSTSSVSI